MRQAREYLELRSGGVSYVRYGSMEKLSSITGAVFDCDGVLIDERTSYDEAIKDAASALLSFLTGMSFNSSDIPSEAIYRVRAVGSFNNDCDTLALIVEWVVNKMDEKSGYSLADRLEGLKPLSLGELAEAMKTHKLPGLSAGEASAWLLELGKKISSLEGTAASLSEVESALGIDSPAVEDLKKVLNYPERYGKSLLTTVFDEVFFGSEYINAVRGSGPFFSFEGKLRNEKLLVEQSTLESLRKRGIVLGMSTGRGSWETWKTLGALADFFDKKACVFIGDYVSADPSSKQLYEKPSPWSLLQAVKTLGNNGYVIYVGNSVEDFLMFRKAKQTSANLLFAGVYGQSHDAADFFLENGADLVITNVNIFPKILELLEEA
ncbi:MAG: hypothetical protein QXH14_00260 [Candidatus Caldarchaeum sp.]